jgi:hypothetical protein
VTGQARRKIADRIARELARRLKGGARMRALFFVALLAVPLALGCGGADKCDGAALPEAWKPHADLLDKSWTVCSTLKGERNKVDGTPLEMLEFDFDEKSAHEATMSFVPAFEDSHPDWKRTHQQFLDTTMYITWEKDGCPTPDQSCSFKVQFFDEKAGGKGRAWGFANLEISPYTAAAAAAPPPH